MPSSGSLWASARRWRHRGSALLTAAELRWRRSPCPGGGVLPSRSAPLASPAARLRSGGLRGRAAAPQGHVAGLPVVTAAQGTSWWLWESLDLTSDLGKALTRRKDTASSYVSSYCRLCAPRPSAPGRRQRGGRWPVGRGRLGVHLAMVSTVNTILHKSSLK